MITSTLDLFRDKYTVEELYDKATMCALLGEKCSLGDFFILETYGSSGVALTGYNVDMSTYKHNFSHFKIPEGITHIKSHSEFYTVGRDEKTYKCNFGSITSELVPRNEGVLFSRTLQTMDSTTLWYMNCDYVMLPSSIAVDESKLHKCYATILRYKR